MQADIEVTKQELKFE